MPHKTNTQLTETQYLAYPDGQPDNLDIRQAYADHLQQFPWDFYITVTCRRERRDMQSFSLAVQHWLTTLDASRAFLAVEPHQLGGIHIHALSRHFFRPQLLSGSVWKYLYKASGRTTVEAITDAGAVSSYCAKYVLKGKYHYDYMGDKAAWMLDS